MKPEDTLEQAWEVQLDIYRQLSPARKISMTCELNDLSRSLLESGVRRTFPNFTEREVKREVIRRWLGSSDLFQSVYLTSQSG